MTPPILKPNGLKASLNESGSPSRGVPELTSTFPTVDSQFHASMVFQQDRQVMLWLDLAAPGRVAGVGGRRGRFLCLS